MINDALESVVAMRRDNADLFALPEMLEMCFLTEEEIHEFQRVWDRITNGGKLLRRKKTDSVDLHLELQLEYGQAMMDLLSMAIIANINPDFALHMAIEVVYDRCREKRRELEQKRDE